MSRKLNKVYSIPEQEFKKIVENNTTYVNMLREMGLSEKGGNSSKLLKRRISELNLSVSHLEKSTDKAHASVRKPLEEILIQNSTYMNISRLKIRLVKENKLEYKCNECGNTGEWQGKPLTLQLDHINGINNDHRLENLRFLCPNCHSLTDTYAGRNIGV